ncbi:hypothetical protein A1Q1_01688 [Trichosporon asahii var. asahii CBS 2479]|uniref:J domain-containing protein n=1 Tax=Trichosporon asahii var. asahii (strain ATCC 90039 / CBS 2479 / JCM 2466 / KCTC 7840 / NBRC 103889/ NCYC 2677 / UAMH 7654) TaxID=1186058 RepID=J6F1Z7_TRIAS|nr:hypothetical protein A1Q1_01688 [Trichosporon asahii var. asahii CBS 2479]EJT49207.1 hypothetical protein A1Q1_01688 [Trichosporon asahii var. asahii CBS 2479]
MHACPSCMSAWSVRSASASGSGYNYDVASPSAFGLGRRYAHAAAMPEEEAGPSRPHRDADYKFPERGARGGPPDPFEILGLERSALPGEIKAKSDYKLALILHPDSSHPAASAEHFATLNKAYKLLSDPAQRRSFLQTGYGWASKSGGDGVSAYDQAFHDAVRHAKQAGAAEWRGRGFRDAEAGSGAWTYARYAEFARASEGMGQGMAGEWAKSHGFYDHRRYGANWQAGANTHGGWHPYMADGNPGQGTGEPIYMSNLRFFALIAAFSGIFAFAQMFRVTKSAETHKELLKDKHIQSVTPEDGKRRKRLTNSASQALAEAREEAKKFGHQRREQIKRRVKESNVLKEIDQMEVGGDTGHRRIAPPSNPEPPATAAH